MFAGISSKPGIYEGSYDASKKEVTVKIIDASQQAAKLKGTGLASGLDKLYKNNHLIKIQVGTQEERDLDELASAQPSSGMTLQQLFATIFGTDVLNEVQKTGEKTGTLLDFIDKSVVLKLTIQQKDCEGEKPSVILEYTIKGIDGNPSKVPTIDKVTEGDKKITGKGEPGAEIVVKDNDGRVIGKTTVKDDKTWEVKVPDGREPKKGDKITATQTEKGKNPSKPAETTVKGKEDTTKNPTIDQPYEGDNKITGKGEPGAKIVVKDKDDKTIGETTIGKDGKWEVPVPADKPLKPGDIIKATQTDSNGKTKEATATVKAKGIPTPTYNYITLTLDENYRGGEITHHDVLEGDLIERYLYTPRRRGYVFEGWSYNSRRLDEVKPGDRIYYPTTLYAIWAKDRDYDRDEREEEPEDLRPVHDHNAYMFGYTDGTVRPNGKITRAEAAALVTRLLGLDTFASAAKPMFSDTPSSWYNKAINAAVQRGIMKGYPDGRFRPNAPITRAEFTQMISTIDNKPYGVAPFADVKGHWAERPIGSEYQAGRIMGYPDQTFRPNAFITRCEAVVILNKMFERNYDAMSLKDAKNAYLIKGFIDLPTSFWGYYDMIEATNSHSFKRRVEGKVQEDWTLVK